MDEPNIEPSSTNLSNKNLKVKMRRIWGGETSQSTTDHIMSPECVDERFTTRTDWYEEVEQGGERRQRGGEEQVQLVVMVVIHCHM